MYTDSCRPRCSGRQRNIHSGRASMETARVVLLLLLWEHEERSRPASVVVVVVVVAVAVVDVSVVGLELHWTYSSFDCSSEPCDG